MSYLHTMYLCKIDVINLLAYYKRNYWLRKRKTILTESDVNHRFLLFLIAASNVVGQCSNLLAAYSSTSLSSGRTLTNNRGALFSVWNSSYVAAASSRIVSTSRLLSRGRIRNRSTRCKIRKQDTISDSRGVNSPVVRPVCRLRDAPRLDRPPTDVILFMRESLCTIGDRRGSDYAETAVNACFVNIFRSF